MVATDAMGMAMGQLFTCRITYFSNLHLKPEGFPRQWMVGINIDVKPSDFQYHHLPGAMGSINLDNASGPWLAPGNNVLDRHPFLRPLPPHTVGLFWRQGYINIITLLFTRKSFFNAWQHPFMAMQIQYWLILLP